jgi:glycosyltransferase involved in cell wall biosynthesis
MWKKHKNLKRMLTAFENFQITNNKSQINPNAQNLNVQLVLVGKVDTNEPEVLAEIKRINFKIAKLLNCSIAKEQSSTGNNTTIQQYNNPAVVVTGFIDDNELPIAYAGAMAYVTPSLSEGFGWPPLEAMACGTPVISSKESCMPEILGDAPIYFDPYDIDDIARAMMKISDDEKLREELSKKGLEQVKKYNWQKCAKETLEVYRKALL